MKHALLLLSLFCAIPLVQAQDLQVASVSPAHGSANVALTTPVSITFNQAINPADSLLIFPLDTLLQQQLSDPSRVSLSPDGRTITFNLTHQADRDYLWVVFYAKSISGNRLAQRYTFYYTTASTAGEHTVSGHLVEFSSGGPGEIYPRLATSSVASWQMPRLTLSISAASSSGQTPPSRLLISQPPTVQSGHLGNWLVLLTTSPSLEITTISRITVSAPDGAFTLDYVRPGTYYLLALFFEPGNLGEPAGYGIYDANQDGTPDALQIPPDLSGLNVPVIRLITTTALEAAALAQSAFQAEASDAQIVFLMGFADTTGRSLIWNFTAYVPSQDTAYTLEVRGGAPGALKPIMSRPYRQMQPLPLNDMQDSDTIVAAFMNRFPSRQYSNFQLMAGQLYHWFIGQGFLQPSLYPVDPELLIWLVQERRPLAAPLQGELEYSAVYNLQGNEQVAYEPIRAKAALNAALEKAPSRQEGDGIVGFEVSPFDPFSGKASEWSVDLVSGGQALQVRLANNLVIHMDTLEVDWRSRPKLPYPDMVDSDQAAETTLAHNATEFLAALSYGWGRLVGGFLGPDYGLEVDANTPLYGILLTGGDPWKEARYFVHMGTGAFVAEQVLTAREAAPVSFTGGLRAVYPHPVGREATIEVVLMQSSSLTLRVYNVLGQEVGRIFEGFLPAGAHQLRWQPEALPAGIYLLQLQQSGQVYHRSIVVSGQ